MKMNAGIWIGIIGGVVGMLVGVTVVLTTTGAAGIYIATGMLLLFGGMFFLFYKRHTCYCYNRKEKYFFHTAKFLSR